MSQLALSRAEPIAEPAFMCFDTGLSGLNLALDPVELQSVLRAALSRSGAGDLPQMRVVGVEILKHRPGRRCSLAVSIERGGRRSRLFVKVFRGKRGARIRRVMRKLHGALHRTETTRVPAPLHYDAVRGLLVTEFVEGASVKRFLYGLDPEASARRIAVSLADLHACKVSLRRAWDVQDELKTTARWIDELAPPQARLADELLAALIAFTPRQAKQTPIHRDFYPEQLITSGRSCYLLDLDDARMGDPAVDAGNFLAHLRLRAFEQPGRRAACAKARHAFATTFLARSPGDRTLGERVDFYEAASLLRLAGVYAARETGAAHLPDSLLQAARSKLDTLR